LFLPEIIQPLENVTMMTQFKRATAAFLLIVVIQRRAVAFKTFSDRNLEKG